MRSAATRQPLPRHVPFAKISSVALRLRFSGAGCCKGWGHDKRLRERPSDRFCIIEFDQQGAPEIDRGAGEARQDEDVSLPKIISGRSGDAGLKGLVRRTRPVEVRSSGSWTLSPIRFSAAYTIDTLSIHSDIVFGSDRTCDHSRNPTSVPQDGPQGHSGDFAASVIDVRSDDMRQRDCLRCSK
jgi:hypothetical protein